MIKPSVFALSLLLSPAFLLAQKFEGGLSAKAGISQLLFVRTSPIPEDHDLSNRVRFSYQAGFFTSWNFSDRWSLDLEAMYWQQNGKTRETFTYTDASLIIHHTQNTYKTDVSYISVPLSFLYRIGNAQLVLGGLGAYEISQTLNIEIIDSSLGQINEVPYTDTLPDFTDFDLGFKAGIMYRITDQLKAGIEYYNGRINLTKDSGFDFNIRNQYVYATLRYNFIQPRREKFYTD